MNTHQKNLAVKVVAGGAAVITGVALGVSAVDAALFLVDLGFIKTGKEPVKCFMLNPDAKIFKGYRIFDPVTGVTKRVSKKKFFEVMSQIPETKRYVKIAAGVVVGILTVAGITKVLYSEYTKKKKLNELPIGRKIQAHAAKVLEADEDDEDDIDDMF